MEKITHRIVTGIYGPGARLPSVRDLAFEAAVNPNTMQKALSELENSGLVFSERTSGRFVTNDQSRIEEAKRELARESITEFFDAMEKLGYEKEEALSMASRMKEGT